MSKCARHGCLKSGIQRCSTCLREPYCSGDCQEADWKAHKMICKTLKKLSHQLQSYQVVIQLIAEILNESFKKSELEERVLKYLILFAEHQFGVRTPGRDYRERENGERISNYSVEIEQLIRLYTNLADYYILDKSLDMLDSSNKRLPLYEKVLDLLRPWSANFDSSSMTRTDSMNKGQIDGILMLSAYIENIVATLFLYKNQFNLVETHCQRSLTYARLYEGTEDMKADLLCGALNTFYSLRRNEGDYDNASIYAEEAYNCVAIAFNPVHPKVQDAASSLIECLILKGDFDKAELFAQMTLDSLKDLQNGLDQQSEAVAKGYHDLASVIHQQEEGDLSKAEMLARESLRIRVLIDSNSNVVIYSAGLLAVILRFQCKLGSETKELLERALALSIRNYSLDGINTGTAYYNLGTFYRQRAENQHTSETRKKHLHLSLSMLKEALRIDTKNYSLDNPRTLQLSSQLSTTERMLLES